MHSCKKKNELEKERGMVNYLLQLLSRMVVVAILQLQTTWVATMASTGVIAEPHAVPEAPVFLRSSFGSYSNSVTLGNVFWKWSVIYGGLDLTHDYN